jgi:hypothetical protein
VLSLKQQNVKCQKYNNKTHVDKYRFVLDFLKGETKGHKVHSKIKKPPTSHFPRLLQSATLSSVKFVLVILRLNVLC